MDSNSVFIVIAVLAIVIFIMLLVANVYVWSKQQVGDLHGLPGSIKTRVINFGNGTDKTTVKILFGTEDDLDTPPVFLIGSCPLDQRMWDPLLNEVVKLIEAKHRVPSFITYDSRGCGTADGPSAVTPTTDSNLELYVSDFFQMLEQLGMENKKFSVGGWGFGGLIAQCIALEKPHLIKTLYVLGVAEPVMGDGGSGSGDLDSLIDKLSVYRSKYPEITYLTLHESTIQEILCKWFTSEVKCGVKMTGSGINAEIDEGETDAWEISQDSLREVEIDSFISTLKMIRSTKTSAMWTAAASKKHLGFDVYFLSAERDSYTPPTGSIELYNTIKSVVAGEVVLDVKQGLHGYALVHPDELAKELGAPAPLRR
jgi:pimeloyl-ACP methyl ester carboxylesterase